MFFGQNLTWIVGEQYNVTIIAGNKQTARRQETANKIQLNIKEEKEEKKGEWQKSRINSCTDNRYIILLINNSSDKVLAVKRLPLIYKYAVLSV